MGLCVGFWFLIPFTVPSLGSPLPSWDAVLEISRGGSSEVVVDQGRLTEALGASWFAAAVSCQRLVLLGNSPGPPQTLISIQLIDLLHLPPLLGSSSRWHLHLPSSGLSSSLQDHGSSVGTLLFGLLSQTMNAWLFHPKMVCVKEHNVLSAP